ncbi:MAG: hypothetical protein JW951_01640 [Lentisphaerae bacterium]|nr:hypothetical protein [Lentisphaerota bacterium]
MTAAGTGLGNSAWGTPAGAVYYQGEGEGVFTTNAGSRFRIAGISNAAAGVVLTCRASPDRRYTLQTRTNLLRGSWQDVPGRTAVYAGSDPAVLRDTNGVARRYYRVGVALP